MAISNRPLRHRQKLTEPRTDPLPAVIQNRPEILGRKNLRLHRRRPVLVTLTPPADPKCRTRQNTARRSLRTGISKLAANQSDMRPVDQSDVQPVDQSHVQPVDQSDVQPVNQPMRCAASQPTNQMCGQSVTRTDGRTARSAQSLVKYQSSHGDQLIQPLTFLDPTRTPEKTLKKSRSALMTLSNWSD